ncbi:MAG: hypothetical protein ABIK28_06615 [Planctomycetota bacterium]
MTRTMTFMIALLSVFALCARAAQQKAADPFGGTGGGPINGSIQVKVVQDGSTDSIEGAFVMAGLKPDLPFPGNWGFTDASGEITFSHAGLTGPITVTAGTAGFQFFTIVSADASEIVIPLKAITPAPAAFEVGDFVSGIDVNNGLFNSGDGNVDIAFVLAAMTIEDILSFDMAGMLGPMEPMVVMGQEFQVPTNLFVPQQYELFTEIKKDHYTIFMPAGDYTLTALSCRASLADLQSMQVITDLIPNLSWREVDVLNVSISGNTSSADLTVDPDLSQTVTLQLGNLPEDSIAWCVSVGDMDALHGLGRLIPLGLNSIETLPGGAPGSGNASLSTTAPSGEFAGMDYFPVVAVQLNSSSQLLVIADRSSHPQSYTANLSNFFQLLNLHFSRGRLQWNDVTHSSAGSPDVHLHMARITDENTGDLLWEFVVKGELQGMMVPFLPPEVTSPLMGGTTYAWDHVSLGLGYDLPSFDFNDFSFSDIFAHGSHLSINSISILWPSKRLAPQGGMLYAK